MSFDPHRCAFNRLPEGIDAPDLEVVFTRALALLESQDAPDPLVGASLLEDLSDHQWHTYQPLAFGLQQRVDAWIRIHWNASDIRLVQLILAIVGWLGLKATLQFLADSAVHAPSNSKKEILDALAYWRKAGWG